VAEALNFSRRADHGHLIQPATTRAIFKPKSPSPDTEVLDPIRRQRPATSQTEPQLRKLG
jgi:hypothetical protein